MRSWVTEIRIFFFVIFRGRHFEKGRLEGFKLGPIFIIVKIIISRKIPTKNYNCHCLGLGHETMVCTLSLFIFLGCGFCHVYGSTKSFQIVNDATAAIIVAEITGHNWQPLGILRALLKS